MIIKKLHLVLFTLAFSFQFFTQKAQAQVCFSPATNFSIGYSPGSVANADFNGDGNFDLAITYTNDSSISVSLGDGTGNFGTLTNFTVGLSPRSIISDDFNGDNIIDLATANYTSSNVSVLLGNGTGGVGARIDVLTGTYPESVVSSDFNGDGNKDLAVSNFGSSNVSILLGDGLGGFGTATNYTVASPHSLTSADFNGDGDIDLAVTNYYSSNVSILLGNGAGSFGAVTTFPTGFGSTNIINADFNADSKADLAVLNTGSNKVSILLGNGLGAFAPPDSFMVGTFTPISLTIGDFNSDGKTDLATANMYSNNVSILLGNGMGSFGSDINFLVGTYPNAITSADFNGDGKIDLVTANNQSSNLSVLLNQPFFITANATAEAVCSGASLTLTGGGGGGGTTYAWSEGVNNGLPFSTFITDTLTTIIYTVTGTKTGCSDTATQTITINPKPFATFTTQDESSSLYCDGSIVADLTGGTGTIQPEWLDNAQTVLATIDSIGALCSGTYTLNLIDVNLCTNTYTKAVQAGPLPPSPPICLITVDITNTHNIVVWEKTNLDMTSIDSFVVYREITTNNYQPLGTVSKDSLSTFDDFAANPATTGYRYKLKSKNTHGVLSLFCDYHNTIYLNNNGANFNWTPYQVQNNTTPVSTYNVYRDDNSTGNFILIGNTTGNQFGYTDIQFASFPDASYYVEAVMAAGACQPTRSDFTASRSNVKHFGAAGVQELNNHTIVNIYPNPAGNTLNITGITGKTTLLLYDVVGKLVLEKEVENNTILNTSHYVDGIYNLLTESKMGRSFNKVVISR